MAVIGGITVEEMREGFDEGIHSQGPEATKKFLVPWANRYTVANALLGLSSGTGPGGSVNLTAPASYPESQNMFVREIGIEGKGKCTQGPLQLQFAQAILTVNYGVPQFGYIAQPNQSIDPGSPYIYATQDIDFSRERVTLPKSSVTLANGHKLKDLPYSFPIVQAVFSIQLHQVPYLPAAVVYTAMKNPINNATFLGIPAGYLIFNGGKNHQEAASDGTYTQAMSYVFTARTILRWDEVLDPDGTSGPQQVRYNGAAILGRSNLATLIPSAYGGAGP